ncbi:MAG: hypothetical protein ACI31I_04315, partial [Bacilli bacterium]
LTSKWDDYKTIKWGEELCIIYDFVTGLYDVAGINMNDMLFSSKSEEPETPSEKKMINNGINYAEGDSSESNNILDELLKGEHFTDVISLFTGINADGSEYDRSSSLLDSNIIYCSFDKLMNQVYSLLSTMKEGALTSSDKEEFDNSVHSLSSKNAVKEEFNSILYATKYLAVDSGLIGGSLDLEDSTQKEAISNSGEYIDKSKILSTVIPSLLKSLTSSLDFGSNMPITGSDLNFRGIKFGIELPKLINCYSDILTLSSSLSGSSASDIITNIDVAKLSNVLKTFKDSKILNPTVASSEKCNFYKVLDIIFDNDQLDGIGFYPGEKKPDYNSVTNWDSEIDGIANIFGTIQKQDLVSMIVTTNSLDSFDGSKIEILLGTIDGSKIISKTFGSVLDNALG